MTLNYCYNLKSLPPLDRAVIEKLDAAAVSLVRKVRAFDPDSVPLTDEAKTWLRSFQHEPDTTMRKYVHLMAWVLYPKVEGKNLAFIDHGGALGLMSCYAREAGLSTVIYNDIFEPWQRNARIFGEKLGLPADSYILGEIQDIAADLKGRTLDWCGLVSVNVIEHIYDMDDFLRISAGLTPPCCTLVLSTSANPFNPLVKWRHHQHHREWEFQDGPHKGFVLEENTKAFYKQRVEIIRAAAPALAEADVAPLAAATRGLRKDHIEAAVRDFEKTGKISVRPEHPTNTCDPKTGCWEERLLDAPAVAAKLEKHGFKVSISGGYYDGRASGGPKKVLKKAAAQILNEAISRMGQAGASLAPCFMFHASRNGGRQA